MRLFATYNVRNVRNLTSNLASEEVATASQKERKWKQVSNKILHSFLIAYWVRQASVMP